MSISSNKSRILIFVGIALLTFTIWFADGYLQWVNSDTAGDAYGTVQYIGFPRGLVSQYRHHSRITGAILSYIPFHTVGYLYRELTNDPVSALYISQGVLTGTIFMLLVMISAAYISTSAPILSSRYLVSAALLMLFIMTMPTLPIHSPISLVLRFGQQSVMNHYVGTMVIALFALFPYWRYIFSGNWDDWYNNVKWRSMFYIFVIAAVFSSTATMIWLGTFALTAFLSIVYYTASAKKGNANIITTSSSILKNSKAYPLILIMILFIVGVIAESTSERGSSAFSQTNLFEYVKVYVLFFVSSSMMWYTFTCLLLTALLVRDYRKETISYNLLVLARIFPWLVVGNLVFIFVVGMPRVPYRFSGYNLGPDTVLPATWSMVLWLMAVLLGYWRENKLTWLSPLLFFVLITNSLFFLTFPWYESREQQKKILSSLHRENINLPMDITLPIPVENVAFNERALKRNTIPMLRNIGIISLQRKISVVLPEFYESWHVALSKNENLPLAQEYDNIMQQYYNRSLAEGIDFSRDGYPNFLAEVSGMSDRENWGRWTDANMEPTAKFRFKQQLPEKFTLEVKLSAIGQNVGVPIKVRVGMVEKTVTVADTAYKVFRLDFDGVKGADTIEIMPPKPTSLLELSGAREDTRKLGVGLVYLKILK